MTLSTPAFDSLADTYDSSFTHTPVGRALREMVWARLQETFGGCQRVLDIGCGTGEDAVRLASAGAHVTGTDASPRMIEMAQRKAIAAKAAAQLEFHCLPMEDIGAAFERVRFDGVLSNFGAINCARDLPALIGQIAARLEPGAPLLWVVMGRHVPWEWAWFLLRGDWRRATRRLKSDGTSWRGLTIQYPTPARLERLLRPHFSIQRVSPLGVVLPPSYAAAWLDRSPRALQRLTQLELAAHRFRPLAACADHYIIEAIRLPAARAA
jgi:SAM-dependent methyltransferase